MFTILPNISNTEDTASLKALLSLIDGKIAKLANKAWVEATYGEGECHDCSETLLIYKDIITQKVKGCGCYNSISIDQIISKIKTLTK